MLTKSKTTRDSTSRHASRDVPLTHVTPAAGRAVAAPRPHQYQYICQYLEGILTIININT